jgi:hypothetical protein
LRVVLDVVLRVVDGCCRGSADAGILRNAAAELLWTYRLLDKFGAEVNCVGYAGDLVAGEGVS